MAIVSALSPISLTQFFYASGKIVRPARLYFYKPNTEDGYTVYTEPTLGVPYEQPVLTGGSGRVPPIYVGGDPYRIRVFDSYGSMIEDIDYLPGAFVPGDDGGGSGMTDAERARLLKTGDMFFGFANALTTRSDCVRANGGLIAPPGFPISGYADQIERQNDDTHDLFVWLWGQDHEAVNALPIIGGRGDSAEDDWALNRAITLPDLRGRVLIGLDGMGKALSLRLPGGITDWSGIGGGNATTTQTVAQMPGHNHGNATGLNNADLGVNARVTGASISQPTQHAHSYISPIPELVSVMRGGTDDGVMVMSSPPGVTPLSEGTTGGAYADISLSDPGHFHTLTQNQHLHSIAASGNSEAMQTISPFCTAVVFIKL